MIRHVPLSRRVLAVAVVNEEVGDWAAYVDAVPGINHSEEWQEVASGGSKLPESIASLLFGSIADRYSYRP